MAHETALQSFSAPAGADLSALQYTLVSLNTSGEVVTASANALAVGVLQNNPVAGEAACVARDGETKIKFGATVASGASVEVGTTGRAITATGTGSYIVGIVSLGGDADEIGSMVLKSAGPLA